MKNKFLIYTHVIVVVLLSSCGTLMIGAGPKKNKRQRSSSMSSKNQLSSPFQQDSSVHQEIAVDQTRVKEQKVATSTLPDQATEQVIHQQEQPSQTTQEVPATQLPKSIIQPDMPPIPEDQDEADVIFNFENADLQNLISYIEHLFKVTFIPDDTINPILQTGKAIAGNKISFKTQRPLTKKQAWSLFITFLDMAGLSVFQEGVQGVWRITTIEKIKKSPIPAYIGVNPETLPNDDIRIRYIYFIENTSIDTLRGILDTMKGSTATLLFMQELKAFMITDSAYNIKVLMRIVKELDKVTMPQAMSVLKLKRVDATRVKQLYDSLIQQTPEQQNAAARIIGPRVPSQAQYFPEDVRIIAEPRTNSLVILGAHEAISKIEDFIIKHIDIDLEAPYSPLHIFTLKYADAATVANIMTNVSKFGQNSVAAQVGGVRGTDKYLKPMTFTAEPTSNRVIVRGDFDDYLKAKEVMEQLDEPQPQVAMEILILSLTIDESRELGAQIRSKSPGGPNGLLGNNVDFQTSGLRAGSTPSGVVTNTSPVTGSQILLGNLINLVVGKGPGNTIVSLGTDQFGVWGIFQALQKISNAQVVSNPFLIATNKTPAIISLGETRRVLVANVISGTTNQPTFNDAVANLTVKVTPQINSDGMIILAINIQLDDFVNADPTQGSKFTRVIDTTTIVANKEILALGGLIRNTVTDNVTKTPILGDIPILGWLFKNKRKEEVKTNLLVLISTRIIEPLAKQAVEAFTKTHLDEYQDDIRDMQMVVNNRDIIDRTFFKPDKAYLSNTLDNQIFRDSGLHVSVEDPVRYQPRTNPNARNNEGARILYDKDSLTRPAVARPIQPVIPEDVSTPPIQPERPLPLEPIIEKVATGPVRGRASRSIIDFAHDHGEDNSV